VNDLTAEDIEVANGTKGALSGSGMNYSIAVTPLEQGVVTCRVPGAVALDAAGNGNDDSNQQSVTYDSVGATCTVTGTPSPTNGTPVEFTLTFNEPVTGLQSTGVTLTNGVVSGFSGSGETYTLAVMPSGEGAIGCQVPVGVALDAAGNGNTESNFLTVTYDSVGPTCVVTGPASPSNDTPVEFTLTFNEPVTGLQSGAIVVSNGVAGPVSGSGTTYMLPVTPSYQGAVSCQVPGGVALDAASNGNVESNQLNVIYDPISPAVTLESSSPDPTNAAIAVTAAFSEKTTDFAVGDIVRTNATVTAFGGNGISYFWTLTPRTQGSFSCSIPAAKFTDAAGNANSSSNVLARTFDSVSPAVVLASNSPGLTNAPITVTATLSEADTDFTAQSVTATNATVSDFAGGGLSYSWTLTAKEQGEFSCSVETGKFTDAAGNANSVSNTVSRTYDSVLPTAVLTSSSPDPTNAAITVAATLSEADADLTSEAVTTTNATLTAFSGNGLSYSWTLTPIAQGEFSCVIEAGRFADAAANVNAASNAVSRNYDSINPTLTLASVSPDFTNTAIAVTATLSEASTDFAAEGVTATNATVTGFTGSGSLYSWTLTPTGQGSFSCSVEAARFIDAAGNANTASNALARIYDSVSPTIVLNSNSPERVDTVITVTATLSEPVTDFTAQDVTATNSILSGFEGDGTSYSWTLTPAGQGTFACFVRGAKFADAAGNQNAGLVMLSRTYDSVSPSIILGSNAPDYVDAAISVTATLSEPSTDFAAQDIVATNATVSGFGGNGATYAWTLTPTAQGSFSCEVEAGRFADDVGNLNTASNTIARIHNSVPVADAGADQSGNVGVEVVLDGSGSADADGQTLAYSWTLGVPDGSGATLDDVHSAQPKFTPDARGVYRAALVVTDGLEVSAKDEIVVTVGNRAPVADAGDPQTVKVQDTVTLDGTGSYDLDGDSLTYAWTLSLAPAESTVVLDAADTPHASFVVDKPGDYTILLIVSDGVSKAESIPAAVVISTQNSVPIAEAGPDQTTRVGEPVTLDGSGSYDVDSDTLTYRWEIVERPEGSTVALDFPDMLSSQIVPDKKGQFVIQLVVDDGVSEARSEPDRVTVTTENSAPVADAGPPQTIHAGQIATVDASGSYDRDGDSIIYAWSISSRPEGSLAALSDASAVRPTFVADKLGEYILQLIVNDGFAEATSPDTVVVTTENSIPVAEAGLPRTVYVGDTVTVDGSASQDSDGDALGYNWSIISRPADSAAKLEHADAVEATFVADRTGDYVLQLIVDDGVSKSPSQPDTVTITTECSTPVANAGPDQDATVGGPVTLDGSDSPEANGEPLTYTWALLSVPPGSTAQLDRETSATPEFSPDVAGVYVAQLTVNDSCGDSLPDTVVVTVGAAEEGETPEGAPLDGESPEGIVLDGEAPDGEVLPEGAALEGERPEGAIPDGETVEGEAVDGEILEGEPVDGEAVEGQISDGEPPEGQTEEDQTREGLPSEGDTPAASIGCTVV
jgi:hypothetical protein